MDITRIQHAIAQLRIPWEIQDKGKVMKHTFTLKDFTETMQLVNAIANCAQQLDHHPDMHVSYNAVTVELSTHATGDISEKDIELAQCIEKIPLS